MNKFSNTSHKWKIFFNTRLNEYLKGRLILDNNLQTCYNKKALCNYIFGCPEYNMFPKNKNSTNKGQLLYNILVPNNYFLCSKQSYGKKFQTIIFQLLVE